MPVFVLKFNRCRFVAADRLASSFAMLATSSQVGRLDLGHAPALQRLNFKTLRIAETGNPRLHATWFDEHANRLMARVTARCHRLAWERMAFFKYDVLAAQSSADVYAPTQLKVRG